MYMSKADKMVRLMWRIFAGMGGLFVGIALAVALLQFQDLEGRVETQAQIVDFGNGGYPIVAYEAQGQRLTCQLNFRSSSMQLGQPITVYYRPEDPGQASVKEYLFPLIFGGIGGLFLILGSIGLAVLRRGQRRREQVFLPRPADQSTDHRLRTELFGPHQQPASVYPDLSVLRCGRQYALYL